MSEQMTPDEALDAAMELVLKWRPTWERNSVHVVAIRKAFWRYGLAELRAMAANRRYMSGCVCHGCEPLRARIAALPAEVGE